MLNPSMPGRTCGDARYGGSPETYFMVGDGLGRAMVGPLGEK